MKHLTVAASVDVRNVSKTFAPAPGWLRVLVKSPIRHELQALKSVTLTLEPGEVCALVGPNGAGKTTLFRILVGLTTPTSGVATVLGHDVVTHSLEIRRNVGWMPTSDESLFQRHTCADNLRFHGRLHGLSGPALEDAVSETLDMVGLRASADNAVITLSAGMKARLQLARALLHRPQILILDEPTASVDPVASLGILDLIMEVVEDRQLAAIVSSHRLDEIEALHSRVLLLHRGEVLHDGELALLRSEIEPKMQLRFTSAGAASKAAAALATGPPVEHVELEGANILLSATPGSGVGSILRRLDGQLDDLVSTQPVEVPLREVLAEVYGVSDKGGIEKI
jgi:ABC-2 type transport system ATP-binding protein